MPTRDFDPDALLKPLLDRQMDVISREQALAHQLTAQGWRHRVRPGGPWRVALPGVAYAFTGQPAYQQRQLAALLYGGDGSVLTSNAALAASGLERRVPNEIDVLVPHGRLRKPAGFVRLHRTRRLPQPIFSGPIRYAPVQRAVADFIRHGTDLRTARALVASALQRHLCTLDELNDELTHGPIKYSALLRDVLAEATSGVASIAEADALRLIENAGLPRPQCNVDLFGEDGRWIARPDMWWPDSGVVLEIDSREWHLSPEAWERTMERHARMSAAGILVLHVSPRHLHDEPTVILARLAQALRSGRKLATISHHRPAA